MENKLAASLLATIAQEVRLEVFRVLVQVGQTGLSAGVIAERLAIPASTLSFHLKELSRSGLVNARQESRYIFYSANYQVMNDLLQYLTENCCLGESICCADTVLCADKKE